jgi:hypothetical protein
MNHICEQRTYHDIEDALNELPQGLDQTFIRSLKKIDVLPPSTRERIRRALQWVVCTRHPLSLAELAEAVVIDEMGDTWDPRRRVDD